MIRSARPSDTTGNTALGHVAGESMLAEVLSRIEDEYDRALIMAHKYLDISLRDLERSLKVSREELAKRVNSIIAQLRQDEHLVVSIGDIRRVGRIEQHQELAFRVGLQDWFCSWCGEFMVQSERGPMKKTCKSACRTALSRAQGVGWKSQGRYPSVTDSRKVSDRTHSLQGTDAWLEKLLELVRAINEREGRPARRPPERRCRDRALILLGFMCPIPLSPSDLATLNAKDVVRIPKGLEVALRRPGDQEKRYIVVPASDDPEVCPVTAVSEWKKYLAQIGNTAGPLFIRMNRLDRNTRILGQKAPREIAHLSASGIVLAISTTVLYSKLNIYKDDYPTIYSEYVDLRPSTSLPDYLNELSWIPKQQHDPPRA